MNISKRIYAILALTFSFTVTCHAQDQPIGYWRGHLPYNRAFGVATDGVTLYTISEEGFFTYNPTTSSGNMETYSKVEGMSDVGMQCITYDQATGTVLLAYQNGNIDLFRDNTFYNIPDLKNKVIAGSKSINQAYAENGFGYLSTSIGVLVVDMAKKTIKETYQFILNNQVIAVNGFASQGNYFYTITPSGMFRIDRHSEQLQNFQAWDHFFPSNSFSNIATLGDKVFLASANDLYVLNSDTLQPLYHTGNTILHLDTWNNGVWVSEYYAGGACRKMDSNCNFIDYISVNGAPTQVAEQADGTVWMADTQNGLLKRVSADSNATFNPDGPSDPNAFDIYAYNKNVWVAHGGFGEQYGRLYNQNGISNLNNDKWTIYSTKNYPPFVAAGTKDFVTILHDETDGTVYCGAYSDGLFVMNPDGTTSIYKGDLFVEQSALTGGYPVIGMAFDQSHNLWVSLFGCLHELLKKTTDGVWHKYAINISRPAPYAGGPLVVDDYNQVWYPSLAGDGLIYFYDNNTPDDPTDDVRRLLTAGVGYGNLPSTNTFCIARDKNNDIWVGTDNGIGIVHCSSSYSDPTQQCDADIPIVQYDQYAGYLFAGEYVKAIAVDGANRKWVGTRNGVWLLSADASKIISRFTVDNSPLPSNFIEKISIDPITGDVYIGTDHGLVSYHGTALDGGTTNTNVISYPNPVPSRYKGTIAIKGLVANADVRITDISGQLVYRTTALGGQAIWNGMDYTGRRPQSGVYLIFVSNADGSQVYSGKMVFMQ